MTQAAYQRSVYRKLKDDHPGLPEYVWEHCTKIPASGEELVVSESLMTGNEQELFVYAAARAVTAVAAKGGHPFGVRVSVLVPEQTEEESVKEMTKILEGMVKKQDIQILNILVQAAPDIRTMTVSVTGLAGPERKGKRTDESMKAGKSSLSIRLLWREAFGCSMRKKGSKRTVCTSILK